MAIRSTARDPDGDDGHGVHVHANGIARVEESVLDANAEAGVFLHARKDREHPTLEMVDSVVRRTRPADPEGPTEFGIGGNARHGVVVSNSEASLSDAAVMDNGGAGLVRQAEAGFEPTHLRIDGNAGGRERCRQQCYRPPEEPEEVTVTPESDL